MQDQQSKPMSKWTNREWRGFAIAITALGIFMFFVGLYNSNWDTMKLGLIFAAIGVVLGFVLHFFFGIKIISIRQDFKHKQD